MYKCIAQTIRSVHVPHYSLIYIDIYLLYGARWRDLDVQAPLIFYIKCNWFIYSVQGGSVPIIIYPELHYFMQSLFLIGCVPPNAGMSVFLLSQDSSLDSSGPVLAGLCKVFLILMVLSELAVLCRKYQCCRDARNFSACCRHWFFQRDRLKNYNCICVALKWILWADSVVLQKIAFHIKGQYVHLQKGIFFNYQYLNKCICCLTVRCFYNYRLLPIKCSKVAYMYSNDSCMM